MFDAFLSYSRRDEAFAIQLRTALDAAGKTLWLDKRDIQPAEDWRSAAFAGIDSADNFLFVISPDSVRPRPDGTPAPCGEEIARAVASGKRLIPIHYLPTPHATIAKELRDLNDIDFRNTLDDPAAFAPALDTLLIAMNTDLAWVAQHTLLQVRATDWQTRSKDPSALLRGDQLRNAEAWLAAPQSPGQRVQPTPLQIEYLTSSRAAETRSQHLRTRIAAAVAILSLTLAAVALFMFFRARTARHNAIIALGVAQHERDEAARQRQEADRQRDNARTSEQHATQQRDIANAQRTIANTQRDIAQQETRVATAGRLAANALNLKDTSPDLALLLALESTRFADTYDTRNVLPSILLTHPTLATYVDSERYHPLALRDTNAIAFAPGGKSFAVLTQTDIAIWDAHTFKQLWQHTLGSDPSGQLAYSPDGRSLALITIGDMVHQSIRVWPLASGQPRINDQDWPGVPTQPSTIAFNSDGTLLAVGGSNGIQVWDTAHRSPLRTLPPASPQTVMTWSVAFSPTNPSLLISGRSDGHLLIEDVRSGQSRLEDLHLKPDDNQAAPVAFSPDGRWLASGAGSGSIAVFAAQANTLKLRSVLPIGDNGIIMNVTFSPDGRTLAAASNHGSLREWDTATLQLQHDTPRSLSTDTRTLAYSPDGTLLLQGLENATMLAWHRRDPAIEELVSPAAPQRSPIRNVAFSPGNKLLAASDLYGGVFLWDVATHKLLRQVVPRAPGPRYTEVLKLSFLADGNTLFFVRNRQVYAFDIATSTTRTLDIPGAFSIAIGPTGLVALGRDDEISLLRLGSPQKPISIRTRTPRSLSFSPDGRFLAAAVESEDNIRLWQLDGNAPRSIPIEESAEDSGQVSFNQDGSLLANASYSGLTLWSTRTGRRVGFSVEQVEKTIEQVSFSPDGKRLALSIYGGAVRLADVETLRLLGPPLQPDLEEPGNGPSGVAFSSDGKFLAFGADKGRVLLWSASPTAWQQRACSIANGNLSLMEWKRYLGPAIPYHQTCPVSKTR